MTTVLGSIDGIAPTYNQTDPWRIWNAKDIFDGSYGSGKYVPKVGDWVAFEDGTSFIQKRVTSISDVLIASYVTLNETTTSAGLSESDIIFGVGPGSVSDESVHSDGKSKGPGSNWPAVRRLGSAIF